MHQTMGFLQPARPIVRLSRKADTGASVQTTLLGLAIALILALLTALVGPYFVNWNDHRAFFEAEASRLIGLNVQVAGPIKVSVLPSPAVTLGDIAIGPAGQSSRLRARSLSIELGLGSLMRGEIRAVETAAGRPATQHRPEQPRPGRLAGDDAADRHGRDRAAQHRGRPRGADRLAQQFAHGARQAVVPRPGALAHRAVPGRGRVRQRRRDLMATRFQPAVSPTTG